MRNKLFYTICGFFCAVLVVGGYFARGRESARAEELGGFDVDVSVGENWDTEPYWEEENALPSEDRESVSAAEEEGTGEDKGDQGEEGRTENDSTGEGSNTAENSSAGSGGTGNRSAGSSGTENSGTGNSGTRNSSAENRGSAGSSGTENSSTGSNGTGNGSAENKDGAGSGGMTATGQAGGTQNDYVEEGNSEGGAVPAVGNDAEAPSSDEKPSHTGNSQATEQDQQKKAAGKEDRAVNRLQKISSVIRCIHRRVAETEEYPRIKIHSPSKVRILSLRLAGRECPWHWEGEEIVLGRRPSEQGEQLELLILRSFG